MSFDSDSFFEYSDFSFVKENPNMEKIIDKNIVKIILFNYIITKNTKLEGFFKIIIPEKLEEGSFFIKIIGKEKKEINNNCFNNNSYLKLIKDFKEQKWISINNKRIKKNINFLKKKINYLYKKSIFLKVIG